jgi:hypothetical protein
LQRLTHDRRPEERTDMDRTERFYKIHQLLSRKGIVPVQDFLGALPRPN